MHFHILTLFPEMVLQGLNTSILARAQKNGLISVDAVNIRDYADNTRGKVDDYTYGGGAGLILQAEPVYQACMAVQRQIGERKQSGTEGARARVVYLTPQGSVYDQNKAEEFSREEDLILLCGHYEGVDERVLQEVVTDNISIGDYVLTGGELPAMIVVDSVSRLIPGVLHNEDSAQTDSFQNGLLEYPQYSRPEIWHDQSVPEVLLAGDHGKVDEWRLYQSLVRTKERRPDLYAAYTSRLSQELLLPKALCPYKPAQKRRLRQILAAAQEA